MTLSGSLLFHDFLIAVIILQSKWQENGVLENIMAKIQNTKDL